MRGVILLEIRARGELDVFLLDTSSAEEDDISSPSGRLLLITVFASQKGDHLYG